MHLLPAERSGRRVIDGERACQAIAALDDPEVMAERARQFAILADPTRLMLLTCFQAAAPISVSDLAVATGINDATVSQTLRYLRATQIVITGYFVDAEQATGLAPLGGPPLRDSAGISPDFAGAASPWSLTSAALPCEHPQRGVKEERTGSMA